MPRSMEDLMLLTDDFGETERFEISVKNTTEDVIKAVDAAMAYSAARGVDRSKVHAIGLMVEEVGTNIVRYAFDDKKDHWLDIFMLVKNGEIRMHFRDNGKPFDPIAYSDAHGCASADEGAGRAIFSSADSNEGGIGLKIIRGLTQDIEYSYNLILNELRVKL